MDNGRVDLEKSVDSLHGEWLNVTRKRRTKTVSKATNSQSAIVADIGANNMFAVLKGDNGDNAKMIPSNGEIAPQVGQMGGSNESESKAVLHKKRPRVGHQGSVPIVKLLENASKARINMAER
ncbi:ABC transporter, partial [Sesbania bispinosa]